ncbi:MAG: PaREP1 family protein [Caldivirga sp.]
MAECHEYLDRGDPVHASERAYKATEEVIKALAEKFKTVEYQEALREGRWYTYLLSRVSKTLASQLGDWVLDGWNSAYGLHVWAFMRVS